MSVVDLQCLCELGVEQGCQGSSPPQRKQRYPLLEVRVHGEHLKQPLPRYVAQIRAPICVGLTQLYTYLRNIKSLPSHLQNAQNQVGEYLTDMVSAKGRVVNIKIGRES
jgi:hypothetical protein